ncbi:hypothetical protein LguiA_027082 [Lonicera macranthoides]
MLQVKVVLVGNNYSLTTIYGKVVKFYLSLDKGKDRKTEVSSSAEDLNETNEPVFADEPVASQLINELSISTNPTAVGTTDDERIRALTDEVRTF